MARKQIELETHKELLRKHHTGINEKCKHWGEIDADNKNLTSKYGVAILHWNRDLLVFYRLEILDAELTIARQDAAYARDGHEAAKSNASRYAIVILRCPAVALIFGAAWNKTYMLS